MNNQEFYKLKPATHSKETGTAYPAFETYKDYDYRASNSTRKLKSTELHLLKRCNI